MRRWLLTPLVASLFLTSFVESWAALVHAARTAGIPYPEPWPWMVDGFIVAMALMVVEADRAHRTRLAWWPRVGLVAATGLSVWIQAAYAPAGGEWLAAWSPLAVLFSFECLVWLWRPAWDEPGEPVPDQPAPDQEPATPVAPDGPEYNQTRPEVAPTRPRVAQGVARQGRPATLGRPVAEVTRRAAQGQSASQIVKDLKLGDRARKGWVRDLVREHRPTPTQMGHPNGDGPGGGSRA